MSSLLQGWMAYAVPVVLLVYRLPAFGQAVLRFLRDLDDYRHGR